MDQDKVTHAFGVINREIKAIMKELNEEGAEAFQSSRYEEVDRLRKTGEELAVFHEKVKQLQTLWVSKFGASDNTTRPKPLKDQPPAPVPEDTATKQGTGLLERLDQYK